MRYLIFHSDDLKNILEKLREAKPVFRKFAFTEILAEFDDGIVGKYKNAIFVLIEKDSIDIEPVYTLEVEIAMLKDGREFKHGKYVFESGKLMIDSSFTPSLFYDILPAIISEIAVSEILVKDCKTRAEHLFKKEAEIVEEITYMSEEARTFSSERLEELSFKVSELRAAFFTSYMRFKRALEEAFESISHARKISSSINGLLEEKLREIEEELNILNYYESRFEQMLNGIRDALDVVHLRLEMLREKENLELQKRTSALQAAAAVIEFVAVYYYTLKIWESFLPIENMPPQLSFFLLAIFTSVVVIYTDILGEFLRTRMLSRKFLLATTSLVMILVLMVLLPIFFS